jgi:hypothetical protein
LKLCGGRRSKSSRLLPPLPQQSTQAVVSAAALDLCEENAAPLVG